MGYFLNGFVFTTQPDWAKVATAFQSETRITGYRHRTEAIWLADVWKPSDRDHWPFTEEVPTNRAKHELTSERSEKTLHALALLEAWQSIPLDYPAFALIRCAIRLAAVSGIDTFCFAADDEGTDVAARVAPTGISNFAVRLPKFSVEGDDQTVHVVPKPHQQEEPEFNLNARDLKKLASMPNVALAAPRDDEFTFYGHVMCLWPAGDATEQFGLGTWDPFERVERDCEIEFEGTGSNSPVPPVARKSWWRPWS